MDNGNNMQSWKFTVIEDENTINNLKNTMKEASEKAKVHFYGFNNPKVVVLISNDSRNENGCQDASCAAENMFLAAQSYGIGLSWINALMKLRNVDPVKSVLDDLGVPSRHTVWCTAVFGYPVVEV